jgi:LacI family transcriptional regulator
MAAENHPTLQDVARAAGVSRTTASFAINGRDDMRISDDARRRVLEAADRLGYRPNAIAKALRTNRTRTIAFVSDSITTDHYAGQMARGALTAALAEEHLLLIAETGGDKSVEGKLIAELIDRRVDGFVYAATFTRDVELPLGILGQKVVLLNCVTGGDIPSDAVIPDERSAGESAVEALLAAGHRQVFLVGESAPTVFAGRERLAGVQVAMNRAELQLAGIIDCAWWPGPARNAVAQFLSTARPCTAMICMNDRVAMGTYQAVADAGLRVPDDISIISFDDSELAGWLHPRLTSVAIPHFALGFSAVEMLLRPRHPPSIRRLPMPLVNRDSIRQLPVVSSRQAPVSMSPARARKSSPAPLRLLP